MATRPSSPQTFHHHLNDSASAALGSRARRKEVGATTSRAGIRW